MLSEGTLNVHVTATAELLSLSSVQFCFFTFVLRVGHEVQMTRRDILRDTRQDMSKDLKQHLATD
jgi:hypothetical protein